MTELTKKYLINGPVNVIRLSNNEKILYLFADVHNDYTNQNECPYSDNHKSIDIDKFLLEFIKTEKKKDFHIFVEMDDYDFYEKKNNTYFTYRDNYINQIRKLINYNSNFENDKIIVNKKYSNFKFYFLDIRYSIDINKLNYMAFIYHNIIYYYSFPYNNYVINLIKIDLDKLNYILEELDNIITNKKNKYINKILNKYKNKNIQKIINKIFNDYIIVNIVKIKNKIKKLNILLNNTNINIFNNDKTKYYLLSYKIFIKFFNIILNIRIIFLIITDLYFIRKFLDNSEIKNTIIYTGFQHVNDIIYILVKYFNFKITHSFYNSVENIKLNKIIKNLSFKNLNNINKLYKYLFNKDEKILKFKQCINLFNFPLNFN